MLGVNNTKDSGIATASKLFLLTVFIYFVGVGTGINQLIKLPFYILLLYLVFKNKNFYTLPIPYIGALAILIIILIVSYLTQANHHFLLIYLSGVFLIYSYTKNALELKRSVRFLIAIVLVFASVQKLISSEYITGDFVYYMINTGRFFKQFLWLVPEIQQNVELNNHNIAMLESTHPNQLSKVTIVEVIPYAKTVSVVLAWLSIVLELTGGLLILMKPDRKLTHIIFISKLAGIFVLRLETCFLSILALSGYILTSQKKYQSVYLLLYVFFISLTLSGIGKY